MKKLLLIAILFMAFAPVDYTDYWCNTVDGVKYECIECAAFETPEECTEYKRNNMPRPLGEPVWDLLFDEMGIEPPPEFAKEARLNIARQMLKARLWKLHTSEIGLNIYAR